jgi:hypothetical protein
MGRLTARENISLCRHKDKRSKEPRCKEIPYNLRNWSFYDRLSQDYCLLKEHNMIEVALSMTENILKEGIK